MTSWSDIKTAERAQSQKLDPCISFIYKDISSYPSVKGSERIYPTWIEFANCSIWKWTSYTCPLNPIFFSSENDEWQNYLTIKQCNNSHRELFLKKLFSYLSILFWNTTSLYGTTIRFTFAELWIFGWNCYSLQTASKLEMEFGSSSGRLPVIFFCQSDWPKFWPNLGGICVTLLTHLDTGKSWVSDLNNQ